MTMPWSLHGGRAVPLPFRDERGSTVTGGRQGVTIGSSSRVIGHWRRYALSAKPLQERACEASEVSHEAGRLIERPRPDKVRIKLAVSLAVRLKTTLIYMPGCCLY